jgi:hypothetical protein
MPGPRSTQDIDEVSQVIAPLLKGKPWNPISVKSGSRPTRCSGLLVVGDVEANAPLGRLGQWGFNFLISSTTAVMMEVCCFCVRSTCSSLRARSLWVARSSRNRTKARIMMMFICTARSLLRTEESIATPSSVKAWGR